MDYYIRKAVTEDAPAISAIQKTSWSNTYRNDALGITVEKLEIFFSDMLKRQLQWEKIIASADGKTRGVWVAEKQHEVIGYVAPRQDQFGRYRVGAIYLLPEFISMGIGSGLLEKVKELYKGKVIALDVATYNESAKRFYLKHGFVFSGKLENLPIEYNEEHLFSIPVEEMLFDSNV
ncbi:MAG: GNAT family N-acetyltransferase [Candidatus Gracilibacteria bacterium]